MRTESSSQEPFLNESNSLVRKFSEKLSAEMPGEALVTSLACKEAHDEAAEKKEDSLRYRWQHLFSDGLNMTTEKSNEELVLDKPSRELAQAWLKFQKILPAGHSMKADDAPPNIGDVWNAVTAANASWTTKREETRLGKGKRWFAKLCESLDNHKYLLDMIPSNDKYISLLSGSLSAIAKATINHDKIAKGISTGLDAVCDDISYWRRQIDVHYSNTYMRAYIAELYVVVFSLLVDIMEWFKSSFRRLIHSFDSSTFDNLIQSKRDKMQILAQKLENEGKLAAEATIMYLPTSAEIASIVSEQLSRFQKEMDERYNMLGNVVQKSVRDEFNSQIRQKSLNAAPYPPTTISKGHVTKRGLPDAVLPMQKYLTAQIKANGHELERYRQPDISRVLVHQAIELNINMEVLQKIQAWAAGTASQVLWIQGAFQATTPSRYTLTSAYIVSTARKADIPVLAYFCPPPGDKQPSTLNLESDTEDENESRNVFILEAKKVIHALIIQLLDLIPSVVVESDLDFSSRRFDSLFDPSMLNSLASALAMLRDLLSIRPYLLFCVIDGLNFLEQEVQKALEPLLDILRAEREERSDKVLKTLYTTDGFLGMISDLKGIDRVCVSDFETDCEGDGINAVELALLQEF